MIETPHVVQTADQLTAFIRFTIPRSEIQAVMGPGFAELGTTLLTEGIKPSGPAFSHHFRMSPGIFDFELGFPVPKAVTPIGRVESGHLPATRVARTVYHGSYGGLGAAWAEFEAWIAAAGYTSSADLWECYVTGPESSLNPADWRTELNRPLVSA
jgi:effector-binding domain-containing protein